jgi:hypothetical protein
MYSPQRRPGHAMTGTADGRRNSRRQPPGGDDPGPPTGGASRWAAGEKSRCGCRGGSRSPTRRVVECRPERGIVAIADHLVQLAAVRLQVGHFFYSSECMPTCGHLHHGRGSRQSGSGSAVRARQAETPQGVISAGIRRSARPALSPWSAWAKYSATRSLASSRCVRNARSAIARSPARSTSSSSW